MKAEAKARQTIDSLLTAAGWAVLDVARADLHAARGVALREFPLTAGHGIADYLLYLDGKAGRGASFHLQPVAPGAGLAISVAEALPALVKPCIYVKSSPFAVLSKDSSKPVFRKRSTCRRVPMAGGKSETLSVCVGPHIETRCRRLQCERCEAWPTRVGADRKLSHFWG